MFSTTTTTPENDSSRPDLIRDRQGQHDGIESIKLTKQDIQEGYDISLLGLQPRNSSSSSSIDPPAPSSPSASAFTPRPTSSSSSFNRSYGSSSSLGPATGGRSRAGLRYEERAREIEREKRVRDQAGRSGGGAAGVLSRLLGSGGGEGGGGRVENDDADEEEKAEILVRRDRDGREKRKKGKRLVLLCLIFGVIALGVGLGVGISSSKSNGSEKGKVQDQSGFVPSSSSSWSEDQTQITSSVELITTDFGTSTQTTNQEEGFSITQTEEWVDSIPSSAFVDPTSGFPQGVIESTTTVGVEGGFWTSTEITAEPTTTGGGFGMETGSGVGVSSFVDEGLWA